MKIDKAKIEKILASYAGGYLVNDEIDKLFVAVEERDAKLERVLELIVEARCPKEQDTLPEKCLNDWEKGIQYGRKESMAVLDKIGKSIHD